MEKPPIVSAPLAGAVVSLTNAIEVDALFPAMSVPVTEYALGFAAGFAVQLKLELV